MVHYQDLTSNKRIARMKVILLVANDETRKNALIEVLTQNMPFHIFVASNAFAALKFLGYFIPHLVIVDDSLPDMTGIKLYDYLHVNRMLETLRVIMVCGDLEDVREELEARHIIGFSIPLDLEKFVATIETIFTAYSSE
jgi:DNA-binding NtrC family response regulator